MPYPLQFRAALNAQALANPLFCLQNISEKTHPASGDADLACAIHGRNMSWCRAGGPAPGEIAANVMPGGVTWLIPCTSPG